jgi:hypothetical protein
MFIVSEPNHRLEAPQERNTLGKSEHSAPTELDVEFFPGVYKHLAALRPGGQPHAI